MTIKEIKQLMKWITRGKWVVTADGLNVKSDLDIMICEDGGEISATESKANARLIAAAPEAIRFLLAELDTISTLIAELWEADRLYAVAETGEDYSNAHQAYQDALKKLFAWRMR